jgi:hypothetical protein
MADDIEFVNGLIVKEPHINAPDFVKCSISIKVSDFTEWLSERSDEWVNIDVKEAKSGRWYASVNNFKPKNKDRQENKPGANVPAAEYEDDIPF